VTDRTLDVPGLDFMSPDDLPEDYGKWLIHGPQGFGKRLAYGTQVLTPGGWAPIEKVNAGDRVTGVDGRGYSVMGTADAARAHYLVTLHDGGAVLADGEHLWEVRNRKGRRMVLDTEQIREGLETGGTFTLPRMAAAQHPERALPIPPYMLGALIADGSLSSGRVVWTKNCQRTADLMRESAQAGGFELRECSPQPEAARRWVFDADESGALGRALSALGLRVKSREKFIPAEYLVASIEQRQDLLAGLFDGDGRLSAKGQRLYHSTSYQLAKDVQQLCWSLGIGANLSGSKDGVNPHGDGTWRVGLTTPYNPFRGSQNREKVSSTFYDEARRIVSVESAGEGPGRCLWVDSPRQLYVVQDYIVTHNTLLASTIAQLGPTLFIDLPSEKGPRSWKGTPWEKNITPVRPTSITQFDDIYWKLAEGDHPFVAVAVDSATAAQKMTLRYMLGHDETAVREIRRGVAPADQRTWGQSLDVMQDFATFWYGLADGGRDHPMHVVMTAQTAMVDNEMTGERTRIPDVQRGARSIFLAAPDYTLYCDAEANPEAMGDEDIDPASFFVRFGNHPGYSTKARIPYHLRGKIPHYLGRNGPTSLGTLSRVLGIGGVPAAATTSKKES